MARVVSLVPSATETLLALGVRPIACTRFCEQPGFPTVGGTKDPDVAAIVALAPDVVVVNDEENRREDADALTAAGLAVHSMSPRSVAAVGPAITALADRLGVPTLGIVLPPPRPIVGRAIALIWRRPWMTESDDTFGSSMLTRLGWTNPFGSDPDRYPQTDLDTVARAMPDVVLLPSEPYPFAARHVPEVATAVPTARVVLVDGRDLFWWGARTASALIRLGRVLTAAG